MIDDLFNPSSHSLPFLGWYHPEKATIMDHCQPPATTELGAAVEPLQALEQLIQRDPAFAEALRATDTTEAAASLICERGIYLTPEALWRHRGKLEIGGQPTWRG